LEIRAPEGGLPKSGEIERNFTSETFSKIWSRFHFTREIALNDENLRQSFLDRKDLSMTSEQLFEIFINFNMFDCIGTIFIYLHGDSLTLGPFCVKKLQIFSENLPVLRWDRLWVLV